MSESHFMFSSIFGETGELTRYFWATIFSMMLFLSVTFAVSYLIYFLFTLPMRRKERARLFLDLIETGIKNGQSIEQTIVSIAASRDRSVSMRFHLLAAHIEKGIGLIDALEKVPSFLPAQIVSMLKIGKETGDVLAVLPACRKVAEEGTLQVRKTENYLVAMLLICSPFTLFVLFGTSLWVYPKLRAISLEMETPLSPLLASVINHRWGLVTAEAGFVLIISLAAAIYLGGPGAARWLRSFLGLPVDAFVFQLPWRHKRMQRDFSAMLGVMLDAGVPEEKALLLAARVTGNEVFETRAEAAVAQLRSGVKLTEALSVLDGGGEFRWRLTNAAHGGGFYHALAGWREALDAKAFQQEQSFAHLATTFLVLVNGVIVGFTAIGTFHFLVTIINETAQW